MLKRQESVLDEQGEQVELFISARNLKNLNNIYQSDPECYVYMSHDMGHQHDDDHDEAHSELIGHTEKVKHNLQPDWKDTVRATYYFNRHQRLRFEVFDGNDSIIGQLTELAISGEKKQNFIGSANRSLAQLMSAPDCLTRLKLFGADGTTETGTLMIYADKVKDSDNVTSINWQWCCKDLMKMHIIRGKTDPFAKFYKYTPNKQRILVYQTEVDKKTQDPTWKVWETTSQKLCSDVSVFYVEVWDYNKLGGHQLIGSINIDIKDVLEQNRNEWQLEGAKNQAAGRLRLISKSIYQPPPIKKEITFLDYLRGGWGLRLLVGVDFTFSNGPINRPDSLHFIEPKKMNYYQQALVHVGQIVISYDTTKQVPLFGFGGVPKLPGYTKPYSDDCFPLNGNLQQPTCNDIQGLLQTYEAAVPLVEFSGPTYIAKILENAKKFAQENEKKQVYTVGLVLTDGQIEDMNEALKLIGECSSLPMSIIIIGVGDDDFKYMHQLADLEEVKKHYSQPDVRKITQFVEYKAFKNDIKLLSQKILDRLPKQFMEYMNLRNHKPKSILKAQMSQIMS